MPKNETKLSNETGQSGKSCLAFKRAQTGLETADMSDRVTIAGIFSFTDKTPIKRHQIIVSFLSNKTLNITLKWHAGFMPNKIKIIAKILGQSANLAW